MSVESIASSKSFAAKLTGILCILFGDVSFDSKSSPPGVVEYGVLIVALYLVARPGNLSFNALIRLRRDFAHCDCARLLLCI